MLIEIEECKKVLAHHGGAVTEYTLRKINKVIATLITIFSNGHDLEVRANGEKCAVTIAESIIYLRYLGTEKVLNTEMSSKMLELEGLIELALLSKAEQYKTLNCLLLAK